MVRVTAAITEIEPMTTRSASHADNAAAKAAAKAGNTAAKAAKAARPEIDYGRLVPALERSLLATPPPADAAKALELETAALLGAGYTDAEVRGLQADDIAADNVDPSVCVVRVSRGPADYVLRVKRAIRGEAGRLILHRAGLAQAAGQPRAAIYAGSEPTESAEAAAKRLGCLYQ